MTSPASREQAVYFCSTDAANVALYLVSAGSVIGFEAATIAWDVPAVEVTPIDLTADAWTGLYFCPCDITPQNFKKFEDGTVVALDFGAPCFLPPVFFAVAVRELVGNFAWKVAQRIHYPVSSDVKDILAASYFLVPFGRDEIGQSHRISFYID